jgi:hypothetical protein
MVLRTGTARPTRLSPIRTIDGIADATNYLNPFLFVVDSGSRSACRLDRI